MNEALVHVKAHPTTSISSKDEALVFLHIPKAAGTTLDRVFKGLGLLDEFSWKRAYGTIYQQYLGKDKDEAEADWQSWSDKDRKEIRLITGHLPYGVHQQLNRPYKYITILREPISRTISHFKMGKNRDGWTADANISELSASHKLVDNVQTRMLCGLKTAGEKVNASHLETAIDNIKNHFFLAGTENLFNDMLSLILGYLNAPDILYSVEQRSTYKLPEELSSKLSSEFSQYNEYDIELYKQAELLAEERIRQLASSAEPHAAGKQNTLLCSFTVKIQNQDFTLIPQDMLPGLLQQLETQGIKTEKYELNRK